MADPLIGMSFSFAPAAPSRERDDAPRGGNGSQVLPVAQLDEDFDGQPEDGSEYLFLVRRVPLRLPKIRKVQTRLMHIRFPRREASQRAKITRAPNPYEVVETVGTSSKETTRASADRPDEAWRESFVRNFESARQVKPSSLPRPSVRRSPCPDFSYLEQRMQRAPINALEPIDPADIPPPRDGSTWRVFVSGKRAKTPRAPTQAATTTSTLPSTPMDVDVAEPADELAAMKAAVLASLELDTNEETQPKKAEAGQPRFGIPSSTPTQPPPDLTAVVATASEPEYDRLPRLPSPALISAISGPSIVHVLSHFDDWLTERFEAYEEQVNYVPSTIFAPPSLRRRVGAAAKPAASRLAAPLMTTPPTVASRPPVPLPTAHESHWMLSLLTRLNELLDGDDLATVRQLAKTLVKLAETSAKTQTTMVKPATGRSMESRREDEEEAEGRARCWMIVAAIASTWSQPDLWDPNL